MNTVQLIRYGSIPGMGTFGGLRTDGWSCVTVEREWFGNQHDISCIPLGQYHCTQIDSPRHGLCYQLLDVPERSNIEIHVANVMQELRGCIALGKEFASMATKATEGKIMWAVKGSTAALEEFMHLMNGEDFLLSIERDI